MLLLSTKKEKQYTFQKKDNEICLFKLITAMQHFEIQRKTKTERGWLE